MKIAILDDYHGVALKTADFAALDGEVIVFGDTVGGQALIDRLTPFDVVCLMRERTPMPAAVLDRLPNLKLLVTTGKRNKAIDLAAAGRNGVTVCGTASRAPATSHHTMSLILAATRGLVADAIAMRDGGWQHCLGRDLDGLTLGIVGLGRLGTALADLARPFGMDLAAWSPSLDDARAAAAGVRRAAGLPDLLRQADVVSVHVTLNDGTHGLIDADALAHMKPDAVLVNTSRGPVVPWQPVLDALRADRLGAAALDVYDTEPVPADHPIRDRTLIDAGRLLLTPHVGYVGCQTWQTFYTETVDCIRAWQAGTPVRVLTA